MDIYGMQYLYKENDRICLLCRLSIKIHRQLHCSCMKLHLEYIAAASKLYLTMCSSCAVS